MQTQSKTKIIFKKSRSQNCSTKNMLVNFKASHLRFIQYVLKLKEKLNQKQIYQKYKILSKLKKKNTINMNDYELLYNDKSIQPILIQYFNSRQIYRDLLKSRIKMTTKRYYLTKLYVFERAFRTKKFRHLND